MGGARGQDIVGPTTHHDPDPDEPDDGLRPDWLRRNDTVGRYIIRDCLGVGGMGVIYSAWDPQLDRKLAIKIVRDRHNRSASERSRARLLREGQALARLRHPNVIAVHDVGTHHGRVFVAMEFVDGQTLQRWLLRSPRPPTRALVDVFLQVGRGLAAAHRAGLVHRDVKPENVMIGDDGRVLVLDFGIAREGFGPESDVIEPDPHELEPAFAPDDDSDDEPPPASGTDGDEEPEPGVPQAVGDDRTPLASLTRSGAVIGTPAYMSPEQHRGQRLDARSDQFSFCVSMWEALNGEKPYGEGSRQKLLARMRLGQLRAFRNREVPRRIAIALRRGLSWQPGDRYPNMESLLGALNPRGSVRRMWQGLGLGAAGGLVIGVFSTLLSVGYLHPRRDPAASVSEQTCTQVADELAADWNEARADAIGRWFHASAHERARATWVRTHERLDEWASHWSTARREVCIAHFVEHRDSAARHDRAVACLTAQRQRFAELLTTLAAADTHMIDGAVTAALELPSPALCNELEHLDELDRAAPLPASSTARQRITELGRELERLELIMQGWGWAQGWRTELERSRQLTAAARELHHPPTLARALLVHAAYLREAGELDEAEDALLEAARAGDPHLRGRALARAADLIGARGRSPEARRWLELARALASSPTIELALQVELETTSARLDLRDGLPEPARARLSELAATLERDTELGGMARPELGLVLHELARASAAAGERDQAVGLLRRALALHEQAHGPKHIGVLALRSELAEQLSRLGQHQAALGELERALELALRLHGDGSRTASLHTQRGRSLARAGRCDEAWLELALALEQARTHAPDTAIEADAIEAAAIACDLGHPHALELAIRAVALRERLGSPPELARALTIEAVTRLAAEQPELARERVARARELTRVLPTDDPRAAFVELGHALVLAALGSQAEARQIVARLHQSAGDLDELAARAQPLLEPPPTDFR